jgi:hypothetical protein
MHDIKYFFSIKLIRQFRGGKKNFQRGDKLLKALPKNTDFQNSEGSCPWHKLGPPLVHHCSKNSWRHEKSGDVDE